MIPAAALAYGYTDAAGDEVRDILVTMPARWGRMPPLSRAVVVETGRILQRHGLRDILLTRAADGPSAGLVGGSRWGSHASDVEFADSMRHDMAQASPAIFGYTLANIPLAEAANHFGLTGPVYALISASDPLQDATQEAERLLRSQPGLDLMLACRFDALYRREAPPQLLVTFTLLKRHEHDHHRLSQMG